MTQPVLLEPAYVLHTRSYRDTSLLLELFTKEHGRISAIARGAKSARSKFKGILQPFLPLVVSWCGKTDLLTLTAAEQSGLAHQLSGDALICGFYLNELLMRLLHRYDAHANLFNIYQQTLTGLQNSNLQQEKLREFEKQLLVELGYALQLDREAQTGTMINPGQFYFFNPNEGLFPCDNPHSKDRSKQVFLGENLLALHMNEFHKNLSDAKRLLRIALSHLLGDKPIRSRELFI